jgi:hypothetical protein
VGYLYKRVCEVRNECERCRDLRVSDEFGRKKVINFYKTKCWHGQHTVNECTVSVDK